MPAIDLIYFDAGGGHRAAANALSAVCRDQNRPWEVRLVNLQELLDSLDIFRKITGVRLEDLYNRMLAKGWTLGAAQILKVVHGVIRLHHDPAVRILKNHWTATGPDLVVSVVPNFNRILFDGLRAACPTTPYVTILTDIADYPPNFWIERQPQSFICGSDRAVQQARELGHPEDRIFRASGMILRPKFYQPVDVDQAAERRRLGLEPGLPTALIMFGGEGSAAMLDIASRLDSCGLPLQQVLICGRNRTLAAKLRAQSRTQPRFVEEFTSEVPYYMRLADFFIGKPGPGSISEAVAMHLPVIVERNIWTLPQERYNADWVLENEVGFVVGSFREIESAIRQLLAALDTYRDNTARIQNRAVFEIPDILERILATAAPTAAAR